VSGRLVLRETATEPRSRGPAEVLGRGCWANGSTGRPAIHAGRMIADGSRERGHARRGEKSPHQAASAPLRASRHGGRGAADSRASLDVQQHTANEDQRRATPARSTIQLRTPRTDPRAARAVPSLSTPYRYALTDSGRRVDRYQPVIDHTMPHWYRGRCTHVDVS